MIFVTIIAFIIIFSALILVHEWGHFIMARKAGIKVEEFGIGLPPRAKKIYKDKKGTIYSLNWIPFGGYVKLFGEDATDAKVLKSKTSFASKSILQRTSVIVAGVFMNFVLAWVLITIGFTVGMKPFILSHDDIERFEASGLIQSEEVLYIHEIIEGSPLAKTELQAEDMILFINGEPVPEADALSEVLVPGEATILTLLRGDKIGVLRVFPDEEAKLGFVVSNRDNIVYLEDQKYPVHIAPLMAAKEVGKLSYKTLEMLGNVVTSLVSKLTVPNGVAGPVGIFKMTGFYAQEGVIELLKFMALLSISLGVINIMPFPALDGGRFLFIIFEVVLRKRPSAKWEATIHGIGFILLMLLILVITWNDIKNLIL